MDNHQRFILLLADRNVLSPAQRERLDTECAGIPDCRNDGLSLKEHCEDNGIEFISHTL